MDTKIKNIWKKEEGFKWTNAPQESMETELKGTLEQEIRKKETKITGNKEEGNKKRC